MSKALAVQSNKLDHKNDISDRQAAIAFGSRIRERLQELGKDAAEIGRLAGIKKQSMYGYAAGDRLCGSNKLFELADALKLNARWLISGEGPRVGVGQLVDASAVDWVDLPRFDMKNLTEESKGDPVDVVPFRRDWLFSQLHESTGFWLTALPGSAYRLQLREGDLVICSDIPPGAGPYHEWVCIWRGASGPFVAKFSSSNYREAGEVNATEIAEGGLVPIGRVRAKMLSPIDFSLAPRS